jgi:membrane peptidoglycan carboxypeptidase
VLKVLKVLKVLRRRSMRASGVAVGMLVVALVALRWWPIPGSLLRNAEATSTIVVDRHGTVLYEALSTTGSRARRLDASSLPTLLVSATIAAEDRRFFSHPGVDPWACTRALRHNFVEGRVVEGGSTFNWSTDSRSGTSWRSISISRPTAARRRARDAPASCTSASIPGC